MSQGCADIINFCLKKRGSQNKYLSLTDIARAINKALNQWITKTNAIGLVSKQGKNGGKFVTLTNDFYIWLYPEFRLTLINLLGRVKKEKQT